MYSSKPINEDEAQDEISSLKRRIHLLEQEVCRNNSIPQFDVQTSEVNDDDYNTL